MRVAIWLPAAISSRPAVTSRNFITGSRTFPPSTRFFAFPQLSVREQMAAYKEIIDGSSLEGYRKIAKKEHDER